MKKLVTTPTDKLPLVSLDPETGRFSFSGSSIPEDGIAFYKPIAEWLVQYAEKPAKITECSFKMKYFNSASRKCLVDILKILNSIKEKGHAIIYIWQYEDDDDEMLEMGEEYQAIIGNDFQLKPY